MLITIVYLTDYLCGGFIFTEKLVESKANYLKGKHISISAMHIATNKNQPLI